MTTSRVTKLLANMTIQDALALVVDLAENNRLVPHEDAEPEIHAESIRQTKALLMVAALLRTLRNPLGLDLP